ncbi:MAG: protein-L-isoaspartate(D-aspartate) O-methyltransferase [Chitinophagaceae bacterium]|nr:protein-L-isoaspartate(D-aspartate) O-methyltransferase [Chitinophagaceae bacterium]
MKKQYVDTHRHQALRKQLLDTVRAKGITDEKVLEAMMQVPRHFFMDSALELTAYEDRAFPIAAGQTISQPYTVAYQSQLLEVKPFEKILEVGTGSAYQATVLAEMKAQVFTIERQKELYQLRAATYPFEKRYANLKFFLGDGFKGLPTYAPFSKIIITAAAPFIPEKLLEQLKPGGIMVIPVNEGSDAQRMMRIKKLDDGNLEKEAFELFKFVPMLSGKE